MVNLYQRQRHAGMTMLIVRCISCRNVAIIIVLSLVALFRSKLRCRQSSPFISHFSLTCPLIKTSVRRNLTTTIVFDDLVVKGKQATTRGAVYVITCCAVTLI